MRLLIAAIACLCIATACKSAKRSGLESVDIPQTDVRDQFRIGFCWAYGTAALIESFYKMHTGNELDLSEEAIGFYLLAHQMQAMTKFATSPTDPLLEDPKQPHEGATFLDPRVQTDAIRLLQEHGVVPESVWSMKFSSDDSGPHVKKLLREAVAKRTVRERRYGGNLPDDVTVNEMIDLMVNSGAFASRPPERFEVNGQSISARDYLTQFIGFNTNDWGIIESEHPDDYRKIIAGTKRALARGLSVPFEFPPVDEHLDGSTYHATEADAAQFRTFSIFDTHIVTITDFVNKGGKPGVLPIDQAQRELEKPPEELDYLVLKNSWGPIEPDDRYKATLGYLKYIANGVIKDSDRYYLGVRAQDRGTLKVFVPKDIAADPFGEEPINPKVALPASH